MVADNVMSLCTFEMLYLVLGNVSKTDFSFYICSPEVTTPLGSTYPARYCGGGMVQCNRVIP